MKLKELAQLVSGKIVGDGELDIQGVAPIEEAGQGDLIFVLNDKFLARALKSRATALVSHSRAKVKGRGAILVDNPRLALAKILPLFAPKRHAPQGIHQTAIVPKSCRIGKDVFIGPFVVLEENVSIGDRSLIHPHVTIGEESQIGKDCIIHSQVSIYDRVIVGDRVVLHSGARIGVDGFGFAPQADQHIKIPQIGRVVIEDEVEIYANVCISRATLGATVIGAGTKIDSLSHVAHNCKIGKNCAIVSLVGFAGSVTLKDHVYVAGQAGFNGHLTVGENSIVMGRAGVTKDVSPNSVISGFPAQHHRQEMEFQAALRRLAKKSKPSP